MSESPIFDQLARQMDYERMVKPMPEADYNYFAGNLEPAEEEAGPITHEDVQKVVNRLQPGRPEFRPETPEWANTISGWEDQVHRGVKLAKKVDSIIQAAFSTGTRVSISEAIIPEVAEEQYGTFYGFTQKKIQDFFKEHPRATNVSAHATENIADGTVKVTIEGVEPLVTVPAHVPLVAESLDAKPFDEARKQYFAKSTHDPDVVNAVKQRIDVPQDVSTPPYGTILNDFVDDMVKDFSEVHPNAYVTAMTPRKNPDGSISMEIEAIEPAAMHETGDAPANDLARRQLEMYRAAASGQDTPTQQMSVRDFFAGAHKVQSRNEE